MIAIQTRYVCYFDRCFSTSGVTSNKVRSCGRSQRHREMKEKIKREYYEEDKSCDQIKAECMKINESHEHLGSTSQKVKCLYSRMKKIIIPKHELQF